MSAGPSAPRAGRLGWPGWTAFERGPLLAAVRDEGPEGPEGNVRRTIAVTASRTHPDPKSVQDSVNCRHSLYSSYLRSDSRSGSEPGLATAARPCTGPRWVVEDMPEEIEVADKVGSVSANRYAQIISELRKLVETSSRIQFTIGDYALEVEPMREDGRSAPVDELFTVKDSLFRLAEDIGLSYSTGRRPGGPRPGGRWTAGYRECPSRSTASWRASSTTRNDGPPSSRRPRARPGGARTRPNAARAGRPSSLSPRRRRSPRSTPWLATRTSPQR